MFSYPLRPETSALKHVSFQVAPGERVAIVGPSGAGKTTIFALLLRFYDADSGDVTVDGVKVGEADLTELRSRFAIVPQETELFADSVAANIAYGAASATQQTRSRTRREPRSRMISLSPCRKATPPCSASAA